MKLFKVNLPVLALALGMVFALATTETKSQSFSTLYGYDGTEWVPLTGQLGGENPGDYTCISSGVWCKGNFLMEPEEINDAPIDDADRTTGTVVIVQ